MGVPEFDAIRREIGALGTNQQAVVRDKIDAAEAAYMAKCAEVDRRYLFAGWLQSGHPYYVETTATYEDMDNEVARLRARVAELGLELESAASKLEFVGSPDGSGHADLAKSIRRVLNHE